MTQRTILYPEHVMAKAHFVEFAGWEMPLHYGSQIEEHQQVRHAAGMFDVSHMGIIDITGADSKEFLAHLLANDVNKLHTPGRALYTCMLNDRGGVIDDMIVYYISESYYRLVVNAACTAKDLAWIQKQSGAPQLQITPRDDLAIIAVQGPTAREKVALALDPSDPNLAQIIRALKKFAAVESNNWFVARTGYTGEDGVEIILPQTEAVACWQHLLQQGVLPVGLGARDTLRLEAGLNLYGNDMDETVSPLESNLAWTVALQPEQRQFIGRAALQDQLTQGLQQQLIGIVLQDRGVLRHGQTLWDLNKEVGIITSGSVAPTLQKSIALARVALPLNKDYFVEIRGKKHLVQVVKPPFN